MADRNCAGHNGDNNVRDGQGDDEQIAHRLQGSMLANTQNDEQIAEQRDEHNARVEQRKKAHHRGQRCQIRTVGPKEFL